jgi:hypothetical protein
VSPFDRDAVNLGFDVGEHDDGQALAFISFTRPPSASIRELAIEEQFFSPQLRHYVAFLQRTGPFEYDVESTYIRHL